MCSEGDVELQHCLSTQGDDGTSANPQVFCSKKQICMSSLMPGHPGAFSTRQPAPTPSMAPPEPAGLAAV